MNKIYVKWGMLLAFGGLSFIFSRLYGQPTLWDTLPFKPNMPVRSFFEDTVAEQLYIGGNFWEVDGDFCNYILKWDGSVYQNFAHTAFDDGYVLDPPMFTITFSTKTIFGGFAGVISWDEADSTWQWLDSLNAIAWAVMPHQDKLIIGGRFTSIGGQPLDAVATWDGTHWESLFGADTAIGGHNNMVLAIAEYQNEIYLAGNINHPTQFKEILRWDGSQWLDVGGGIPNHGLGGVNDMVVYKDELYVGGIFTEATGGPGNNIARWNGQSWDGLGGGVGTGQEGANSVEDLFVFDGYLWVSGIFRQAGGIPAHHIARWDGERWCGLGSDFGQGGTILRMASFRDTLHIGGSFLRIDGNDSYTYLAKLLDPHYSDTCSAPVVNTSVRSSPAAIAPFSLYPNPASGSFTLEAEGLTRDEFQIEVTDARGRVVWQRQVSHPGGSFRQFIDLGEASEGIYLVRITGREQQGLQRIQVR